MKSDFENSANNMKSKVQNFVVAKSPELNVNNEIYEDINRLKNSINDFNTGITEDLYNINQNIKDNIVLFVDEYKETEFYQQTQAEITKLSGNFLEMNSQMMNSVDEQYLELKSKTSESEEVLSNSNTLSDNEIMGNNSELISQVAQQSLNTVSDVANAVTGQIGQIDSSQVMEVLKTAFTTAGEIFGSSGEDSSGSGGSGSSGSGGGGSSDSAESNSDSSSNGTSNDSEPINNDTPSTHGTTGTKVDASIYKTNEAQGFKVTTNNKTYNLTAEEKEILYAIVAAESDQSPDDALAVTTTILNRCESDNWTWISGDNTNPVTQATAANQFVVYQNGRYKQYMGGNAPDSVVQAVDAALGGVRNHEYESFRSNDTTGYSDNKITTTGNRYK